MRRIFALMVLWAGLLGAGSPLFACASGATGACCPANVPAGCGQSSEQFDLAATPCCLTNSAPSPVLSAERGREQPLVRHDCGSADPGFVVVGTLASLPGDAKRSSAFDAAIHGAAAADRSLTYLHTGRLRL